MKESKANSKGTPRSRSGVDGNITKKMPYSDFLKVLLDFQLLGHDRFLTKFRDKFREVDRDSNGVLNEEEFRQLCSYIGKSSGKGKAAKVIRSEEEMRALLETADPFNNQIITFSEAVACLSADIVEMVVAMHARQERLRELNDKREKEGLKKLRNS